MTFRTALQRLVSLTALFLGAQYSGFIDACQASPLRTLAMARAEPSASPLPIPTGASIGSADSLPPPTEKEKSELRKKFVQTLKDELKALDHRQSSEWKELKASHKARESEFKKKEDDSRHAFFKDHHDGPSQRECVQGFLERRKGLRAVLKQELDAKKREQGVRRDALVKEQAERNAAFEKALSSGQRPDASLWKSSL